MRAEQNLHLISIVLITIRNPIGSDNLHLIIARKHILYMIIRENLCNLSAKTNEFLLLLNALAFCTATIDSFVLDCLRV